MKPRRFSTRQALTQAQQLTTLRTLLVMRDRWPTDTPGQQAMIESLARSHGLALNLVQAEVAAEDMRRRMRHG